MPQAEIESVVDLTREEVIDPADPSLRPMLEDVQGNILKAYARNHTNLLLLHFTAPPKDVRDWVQAGAKDWVTSAWQQHERGREDAGVFGCFFLTAAGYQALGFSAGEIERGFEDSRQSVSFFKGMAAAGPELNDISARHWEPPYRSPREREAEIHAMVLLASHDRRALSRKSGSVEASLANVGRVLKREEGAALRKGGRWIEPFGFAEGHSQPVFFEEQLAAAKKRGGGVDVWNPVAPLGLVLTPDPFAKNGGLGSHLVFRKLRQDVEGFQARIAALAAKSLDGDQERAAARLVGRFKDGTPLAGSGPNGARPDRDLNDFNYRGDFHGNGCPLNAHIRKVNPRDATSRAHRIVRRGVPYKEKKNGEQGFEQGLLFLCFQSRIHEQFAHIQARWANNPDFPSGAGLDPLIGRSSASQPLANGLVTLKGGEFFFAPSRQFLIGF